MEEHPERRKLPNCFFAYLESKKNDAYQLELQCDVIILLIYHNNIITIQDKNGILGR